MKIKKTFFFGILLISLAVILKLLFTFYENRKPLCEDCNIIVVAIDILSAEHLPCHGYGRDTAPNLCGFADKNVFFRNAYANAAWTLPSVVTMFTGLYPSVHKVVSSGDMLKEEFPLLTELLQQNNYDTWMDLDVDDPAIPKETVFNRGVTKYYEEQKPWSSLLKDFEKNVESGKKTFLFLQDNTLHSPYLIEDDPMLYEVSQRPHIPTRTDEIYNIDTLDEGFFEYISDQIPRDLEDRKIKGEKFSILVEYIKNNNFENNKKYFSELLEKSPGNLKTYMYHYNWYKKININSPEDIEYIKALYDQKIKRLDEIKIKELISFFHNSEIRKNTILVFTSEHGEEFMEHGYLTHISLYDPNTHVPFIIYIPGIGKKVFEENISLTDLAPTLLDLVGIKKDFFTNGISISGIIKGFPNKERIILMDNYQEKVLLKGNYKLFTKLNWSKMIPLEMYDLSGDHSEKENILFTNYTAAGKLIEEFESINNNVDGNYNR